ncbi:unnamed protein product [Fusarium graminearum]|nr:unnamed protein product [Fusarium graminearum]
MDNASFYHNDELEPMCAEAGVELLYLPLYSPDFNPIEEYFAELKNFIKKPGPELSELFKKDYQAFLQACVDATIGPYLNVLDERPGDTSLDALVDVISNVPILIDVPQVETVGSRNAALTAKACFPVLIFNLVAKPFGIIIHGPIAWFQDHQIYQVHYRW